MIWGNGNSSGIGQSWITYMWSNSLIGIPTKFNGQYQCAIFKMRLISSTSMIDILIVLYQW